MLYCPKAPRTALSSGRRPCVCVAVLQHLLDGLQMASGAKLWVQVKRKAEAIQADLTPEPSDSGPTLKQSKSMGNAFKIKLKMPRPTQQP